MESSASPSPSFSFFTDFPVHCTICLQDGPEGPINLLVLTVPRVTDQWSCSSVHRNAHWPLGVEGSWTSLQVVAKTFSQIGLLSYNKKRDRGMSSVFFIRIKGESMGRDPVGSLTVLAGRDSSCLYFLTALSLPLSSLSEVLGGYRLPGFLNMCSPLYVTPFITFIPCVIHSNFMLPRM